MSQVTSAVSADVSFISDRPSVSVVTAVLSDDAGRLLLCQIRLGDPLWSLPGGRVRDSESPIHAVAREVFADIGAEFELIDLVGLYQLTGDDGGDDELPDVAVHVFRGKLRTGEVAVNWPGRVHRLSWYEPDALPESLTATTRAALADAVAGRSGVVRTVRRDLARERTDVTGATRPSTVAAAG
ncbi:NUDIX hydrolase [Planosporangium flavigriseum]|uniref:DNA mismatch repair protein MutT n=1 Tax=Planosporangium flavigriseum TaxID=373681 RepID=A0A8J3LKY3_9ACTN|nr:NUDIX hydrolase [Planosporangium flavigriseum]NJC63169.1 NUDIX hydrolase [Planosporangium flavigriseum]GIG72440.1 DNA mismatch repair protein MutT [Planosporangium flavigriseum]